MPRKKKHECGKAYYNKSRKNWFAPYTTIDEKTGREVLHKKSFPTEEEANQFDKPDWLGKEIGYKELSNRKLAEMTKEQFKSKVPEKVIKNNLKIIEELKQLI